MIPFPSWAPFGIEFFALGNSNILGCLTHICMDTWGIAKGTLLSLAQTSKEKQCSLQAHSEVGYHSANIRIEESKLWSLNSALPGSSGVSTGKAFGILCLSLFIHTVDCIKGSLHPPNVIVWLHSSKKIKLNR